jgi:hypothetical protein
MKYALIIDGTVDTVSFQEVEGWVEIPDSVFGGFIQNQDGSFSPPIAPPVYATSLIAQAAVTAWIDNLTGQIQNQYPSVVQGGWLEEEEMARAFEAGTATDVQLATLANDAFARDRTSAEQATRILDNARSFRAIAKETRRLWLSTISKIENETDPYKYGVIMYAAIEEAAPLAAAYGLS